jgi:CHASE2 domain-containing sensor protein
VIRYPLFAHSLRRKIMANKHKLATLSLTVALALAGVVALLWLWGWLPQAAFAQGPGTTFTYQTYYQKSSSVERFGSAPKERNLSSLTEAESVNHLPPTTWGWYG